jgi:hypothetical protein
MKVSSQHYIDPEYKRLMKSKRGRKQIAVFRVLAEGIMTRNDIIERTGFNPSEVRELLKKGIDQGYVVSQKKIGKVRGRRGHSFSGKSHMDMDNGRPPNYYFLTDTGLWLMGLDPEVRKQWGITKDEYDKIGGHSGFDSFLDLVHAIKNHPKLKKFQEPWRLMDCEMEQLVLSPFVLGNKYGARDTTLYDELVKAIKENVKSEDALSYYLALEKGGFELNEIVGCQRLLLEKMKELPEVHEYLKSKSS